MNTSVGAMYNDLQGLGVDVAELKLKANTAIAFMDNFLVIDRSHCKTAAKERTVLAHEAGHCITGSFYNLYAPLDRRSKHERQADKWAVKKLIPKVELEAQLRQGLEPYELAEYFNVTEEFIHKALEFYFECGIA